MNPPAAILLTSTPIVAAMLQASIPAGYEPTAYWVNYGAFAIMAWAAWAMLKKQQEQAAKERQASEERLERLVKQVLDNEQRSVDAMTENSQQLGELTGVIQRCAGQQSRQFRILESPDVAGRTSDIK